MSTPSTSKTTATKPTTTLDLKRDRFMSARGGTSQFLNIYCGKCQNWLLIYQKDGPGNLFRLYCDRIHAAAPGIDHSPTAKGVTCSSPECKQSFGVHMIYEKEGRHAFRIVPGTIVKKKSKGHLPAPPNLRSQ